MLGERAQVMLDLRREGRAGVAVVVEVELDLAEPGARQAGELGEEVRAVLLAGKEPAVARRATIAVAELAERRVALGPGIDPADSDVVGRVAPQRLVVVAQREQDVPAIGGDRRPRAAHQVPSVVADPVLKVLLAQPS